MTKNNLRVVVLAHVFPRTLDDSMGAFLLHLAEGIAARDVSIDLVAPHATDLKTQETMGDVRIHRFQYAPANWERLAYRGTMHELVAGGSGNKILFAIFNLAFLLKAVSVAWSAHADVIHAHWWLPDGLVGALASLITHKPLVLTTHGTDVEMLRRTGWAKRLAQFVFARARAVTCGSNYLREQLITLNVANSKKINVVPMPLNPIFEKSEIENRKHLHRTQVQVSKIEILTVARLTKQKSIDTLIDAMVLLPDARLHIIGEGPERANLEAQVRELGLQKRVEFLGALPQTELPKHYAACAAFVLPSIREGMGLVFAEALLCGAPVIAANSGGVTDIVQNGETGLLVPERDAKALADAIQKILRDKILAQRLAENGAKFVREHYTREGVVEQFVQIYQNVWSRNQVKN